MPDALTIIIVIGAFAALVIFGDRILSWYIESHPPTWDETEQWEQITDALERDMGKPGLDYLNYFDGARARTTSDPGQEYYDFRPEEKR